jgi:5-methylcytosine-specific restriction endonuclease McrA
MRPREEPTTRCALCGRIVPAEMITLHHLHPKSRGGKASDKEPFCKPCHKQVHAMFSNIELERLYPTIAALREAPELKAFLEWIRKQKPGRNFRTIQAKRNPDSRR